MGYSLKMLLDGASAAQDFHDMDVDGITSHSRKVTKGFVFFALPGVKAHGNEFVRDVVRLGAAAIVTDRGLEFDAGVPVYLVNDVRACFARAACRVCDPQPEVAVAVTGTNGKTSVVSFIRQIWEMNNIRGASVGTLGVTVDSQTTGGELTTPGSMSLHQTLQQLKRANIDHVAMEASSHGLDQRRLDGMEFKVVGFTNLSRDHLDYHETMEAYHDAKLRLFKELMAEGGTCVINMDDDEATPFMFAGLEREATVITVGENGAYFEVTKIEPEGYGQRVFGRLVGEEAEFYLPLAGEFQVINALVAFAMAVATGVDKDEALQSLSKLEGAKGRLELVAEHNGAAIFVDYAHTPDALETALKALRPFAKGRLISVFGCGGDRDKGKRGPMGVAAASNSDIAILTDDNPRTEDPAAIRAQVLADNSNLVQVAGRGDAIQHAISLLGQGDVLLVAGKGHEDYQIIGETKHHFSDHEVVLKAVGA
ncbi:UDP-N-acetylmuramoyl-L-alanyl-D-glutamate--2,6-diaminopimelate ligase [Maritalea sp.]|jgi:UDP-N-acetylmuramoyl-L-alanyl-D-glutamate--2,6-diaminopimelate ligase|uniref:UDP-N-acetylmuramoyl-L-alanyl-D-glutamate--2, 6-diaminopimelate ligase n=1 Tax=Maritalea sp. TaxID=2003361 RepID=UPI0039E5BEFA